MNTPKVSVLMPVYNTKEEYLREAMESILNQTFTDFEFIIIDDGSKNNVEKVIKSYSDDRILYIKNDKNYGIVYSLNKGISLSKGEYIGRMDADDVSALTRIEKQVNFMNNNNDYVIVGSFANVINNKSEVLSVLYRPRDWFQIKAYLPFNTPFIHGSIMMRSDVRKKQVLYKNFLHAEDYEYWNRVLKLGKGYNIDETLYSYREHDTNISKVHSLEQSSLAKIIRYDIKQEYIQEVNLLNCFSMKPFLVNKDILSIWEKQHYKYFGLDIIDFLLSLNLYKNALIEVKILDELISIPIFEKIKMLGMIHFKHFKYKLIKRK